MFFDSHTHLDDKQFDTDRDAVIARAKAAGVRYIMNPGADLASSMRAVELAEQHAFIYAAVGIHPHDVQGMDLQMLEMIEHLAGKEKVKAIGEIGLDYYRDLSPRDLQQKWFAEQIRLAKRLELPVIIHDRDANGDVLSILKRENAFQTGVVMHLYSGSKELAEQYVKLGAMLSIGGTVTFKNARKTVEVAESIPLDHLMIETDAPYIAPVPMRGKRNETSFVQYTCARIAEIRGVSLETIAEATLENAKRFFGIV